MEEHVEGEYGGKEDLKRLEDAVRVGPIGGRLLHVGARLQEVAEEEEGGEFEGDAIGAVTVVDCVNDERGSAICLCRLSVPTDY